MFWSDEPTWISVHSLGRRSSKRSSSAGYATTAARSAKYPICTAIEPSTKAFQSAHMK
jgi:hypothetical protein